MKWHVSPLKTRRNKVIALLVVGTFVAGGCYWYAAAQKPQSDSFRPIAVTRGTIEEVVTAQGKLEAKQYVDVGTQVSGQVKKIHVDIGDAVTKGELLARDQAPCLPGTSRGKRGTYRQPQGAAQSTESGADTG